MIFPKATANIILSGKTENAEEKKGKKCIKIGKEEVNLPFANNFILWIETSKSTNK